MPDSSSKAIPASVQGLTQAYSDPLEVNVKERLVSLGSYELDLRKAAIMMDSLAPCNVDPTNCSDVSLGQLNWKDRFHIDSVPLAIPLPLLSSRITVDCNSYVAKLASYVYLGRKCSISRGPQSL